MAHIHHIVTLFCIFCLSFRDYALGRAIIVEPRTSTLELVREDIEGAAVGFDIPADNGGSQLDSSAGLGEPLNVIISNLSSPEVLTTAGLENWARSIYFSTECLGIHIGGPQTANLGDGLGWQNQTAELRFDFESAYLGTCLESLVGCRMAHMQLPATAVALGGNHFRFWKQVTTGAYFLAASVEEWAGDGHNIVPNGYDEGRDGIVQGATGVTKYQTNWYLTTSYYVSCLLQPGTEGINHNISIDGRVAVLTITKIY
ncbi:hypothetical protein DL93DRAFT_2205069 [Clavulina sp. PMI_390]|nr:hypothetical protein DL93DRAFT_2205069 [Clavulina sp. PMI_390]